MNYHYLIHTCVLRYCYFCFIQEKPISDTDNDDSEMVSQETSSKQQQTDWDSFIGAQKTSQGSATTKQIINREKAHVKQENLWQFCLPLSCFLPTRHGQEEVIQLWFSLLG